jgi:uncharacterized protein YjiS (DUF1127 family)
MNISNAWDATAGGGDTTAPALSALWAAVLGRIAGSVEARRRNGAARRARRLDDRTLRDIGVTRLGLPETALAFRNELGTGGRRV